MQDELFTSAAWDGDQECMQFYNVVLKLPIGQHQIGAKFDVAAILFDRGIIQLYTGDKHEDYKIHYVVGEKDDS